MTGKYKIMVALLLCSSFSHAGSEVGIIQPDWNIYGDGNLFFFLNGTHADSPCSIAERWAINTTNAAGKEISVSGASGAGCTHGNTEPVYDFRVR